MVAIPRSLNLAADSLPASTMATVFASGSKGSLRKSYTTHISTNPLCAIIQVLTLPCRTLTRGR